MTNFQDSNPQRVVWVCPESAFSPWTLSGITREICNGLSRDNLLAGAIDSTHLEYGLRVKAYWLDDFVKKVGKRFNRQSKILEDEMDPGFQRIIDCLPPSTALVYQFLTPRTNPLLCRRRFRFVDLSLLDAIRTDSYGHVRLSDSEIEKAFSDQKRMYDACDGIMTLSTYAADAIARDFSYPRSNITPIGAGATISPASVPPLDISRYAAANILFIGRDWERKGGPLLLDAFRIVHERIPHASLTIVGPATPPTREKGVIFRSPIDKSKPKGRATLSQLFSNASVFCMPSVCETWGLVYTEANAFGTPIVGFAEWALPDIVQHGVTGLLTSDRTSEALAELLVNALSDADRLQSYGVAARNRYVEILDWPQVMNRLNFRLNHFTQFASPNSTWLQDSERIHQIKEKST